MEKKTSQKLVEFDLESFMPYRLSVLVKEVSDQLSMQYRCQFQINVAQWRVMAHLLQYQEISIRELNHAVNMDKVKTVRAVQELYMRGLVNKVQNPVDKRLVSLSLSVQGDAMMQEIIPLAMDFQTKLMAKLTADERILFDRIIVKLQDNLTKMMV